MDGQTDKVSYTVDVHKNKETLIKKSVYAFWSITAGYKVNTVLSLVQGNCTKNINCLS